jgi:hypothetical protein
MKWTSQASACAVAMFLAACNGNRSDRSAPATNSGTETGSMSDTSRMSSDTGARSTGGMSSDTARSGMAPSDTTSGATRSDTGLKGDSARRSSRMHPDSSKSFQSAR